MGGPMCGITYVCCTQVLSGLLLLVLLQQRQMMIVTHTDRRWDGLMRVSNDRAQ